MLSHRPFWRARRRYCPASNDRPAVNYRRARKAQRHVWGRSRAPWSPDKQRKSLYVSIFDPERREFTIYQDLAQRKALVTLHRTLLPFWEIDPTWRLLVSFPSSLFHITSSFP